MNRSYNRELPVKNSKFPKEICVPSEFRSDFVGLVHLPLYFMMKVKARESERKETERVAVLIRDQLFICQKNGTILGCVLLSNLNEVWHAGRDVVTKTKPHDFWAAFPDERTADEFVQKLTQLCGPQMRIHELSSINKNHVTFSKGKPTVYTAPVSISQPVLHVTEHQHMNTETHEKTASVSVSASTTTSPVSEISEFPVSPVGVSPVPEAPSRRVSFSPVHRVKRPVESNAVFPSASTVNSRSTVVHRAPSSPSRYVSIPFASSFQSSPRAVSVPRQSTQAVGRLLSDISFAQETLATHRAVHGASSSWGANSIHLSSPTSNDDQDAFWNHAPTP
eukprot:TRINITY_DN27399_c0_g1_i1.p1 TRINITY_DN27399_c0_g1~~TRINITY_DN27399_c0_g1_i1.p1  ORF type:complete len:363 (+),score=40.45 TRINITY_DN27399_c0_g1_i1:84-1091(+)